MFSSPTLIDLILTNTKNFFKTLNFQEVGIFDQHDFLPTALKSQFIKCRPKMIFYHRNIQNYPSASKIEDYSSFQEAFTSVRHKQAPMKKKILRYNKNPYMIKRLGKQIVLRSKMKDIYNKKRTQENLNSWKKQRNFSVNPLRKTKKDCFSNLNFNDLPNNRKFW